MKKILRCGVAVALLELACTLGAWGEDSAVADHALAHAKVGDWVLYDIESQIPFEGFPATPNGHLKYKVVNRDATSVTFEVTQKNSKGDYTTRSKTVDLTQPYIFHGIEVEPGYKMLFGGAYWFDVPVEMNGVSFKITRYAYGLSGRAEKGGTKVAVLITEATKDAPLFRVVNRRIADRNDEVMMVQSINSFGTAENDQHFGKPVFVRRPRESVTPIVPTPDNADELVSARANRDTEAFFDLWETTENVNFRDASGMTPLCKALIANDGLAAIYFIEHGGDVNLPTADGKTPLHFSVVHCNPVITQYLLRCKADHHAKCDAGETPTDVMIRNKLAPKEATVEYVPKSARASSMQTVVKQLNLTKDIATKAIEAVKTRSQQISNSNRDRDILKERFFELASVMQIEKPREIVSPMHSMFVDPLAASATDGQGGYRRPVYWQLIPDDLNQSLEVPFPSEEVTAAVENILFLRMIGNISVENDADAEALFLVTAAMQTAIQDACNGK